VHCGEELLDKIHTVILFQGHEVINPMEAENLILMGVVFLKEFHIEVALLSNRILKDFINLLIDVFMHLAPKLWIGGGTRMSIRVVVNARVVIGMHSHSLPIITSGLIRRGTSLLGS
jgi:hypothetical protein